MATMFETFGGNPIQPASNQYASITLSANTSLAWPIQFQNTLNNVYNWMDIIPTNNGFTLTLPNAELVSVGISAIFNNPSAFTFTLNKYDGSLLYSFGPGVTRYILLHDNSTDEGSWYNIPMAGGTTSVTSINATSSSDNLVIGGVPITSAGTITFALAKDLASLSSKGAGLGVACRTNTDIWTLRNVVGTNNQISVTNPAGTAGNITIGLEPDITGITSIEINDIKIDTNQIITLQANEDLFLDPNGTGKVVMGGGGARVDAGAPLYFQADNAVNYVSFEAGNQAVNYSLVWPTVAPTDGQVLGFVTGTELAWLNVTTYGGVSVANTIPRFANEFGSLKDSNALLTDLGALSGLSSVEIGNLLIGGIGGTLPNRIASTNLDGEIILSPNGVGEVTSTANINLDTQHKLKFFPSVGANFLSMYAPATLAANVEYILPDTIPGLGQSWVSTTSGTSPVTLINASLPAKKNLVLNGGLNVWQRGTSFTNATVGYPNNDGQYCADAWKLLSNGNDIVNVTRVAGPDGAVNSGCTYAWQNTVVAAGKFGMCQIFDSVDTLNLISTQVYFSSFIKAAGATTVRMAIIGWSGAADNPTSDPISAWNAQGVNPTLVANWAYLAGGVTNIAATGNFADYFMGPVTITAGINNLGLLIWCDNTAANPGDSLTVSGINLTIGNSYTPFYQNQFTDDLVNCKKKFQKDLGYTIAPFTTLSAGSQSNFIVSPIGAVITVPNTISYIIVSFDGEMSSNKTPVVITYPFTTVANTSIFSNNAGADLAANSASVGGIDSRGFYIQNTSGGDIVTTASFVGHWTASTEF